jgi:mono/diheme cytochrome c family protein
MTRTAAAHARTPTPLRPRVISTLSLMVAAMLSPAIGAAAQPPTGEVLFAHRCAPCHRDGGTGTFMLGRRLGPERALLERRSDLVPDYVRTVVRGGLNAMPPLSRVEVPDADLAAIAAYLARPVPR